MSIRAIYSFFFFNDTATTEIYTLSLHDALPISIGSGDDARGAAGEKIRRPGRARAVHGTGQRTNRAHGEAGIRRPPRSEEHTSELQSPCNLVCRLLLEKKKIHNNRHNRVRPYRC